MAGKMVCAVLLGAVAMTGCSTGSSQSVSQADSMWQNRTAHLGDNSKVLEVIQDLECSTGFIPRCDEGPLNTSHPSKHSTGAKNATLERFG